MKKTFLIIIFLGAICLSIALHSFATDTLNAKFYYDCPSFGKNLGYYAPLSQIEFCRNYKRPKIEDCKGATDPIRQVSIEKECRATVEAINKLSCSQLYNELDGNAYEEYKSGKCKITDRQYIDATYGTAKCRIDFYTTPTPQVVGYSHLDSQPQNNDGAKCFNMVFNKIKTIYPNVKTGISFRNNK